MSKQSKRDPHPDSQPGAQKEAKAGTAPCRAPNVEMLEVATLRPHPRQTELVGDMPPAEFEALVADIARRAIQNALIVLADRTTIICGHQRKRAACQLGLERVPCVVRADLVDPDDPRVIELLLNDNLQRRHLTRLQKARYAGALARIQYRKKKLRTSVGEERAFREAIGKALGNCGRHADRYLRVLRLPIALQQSFDEKLLTFKHTEGIAALPRKTRRELAAEVEKLRNQPEKGDARLVKKAIRNLVDATIAKPNCKASSPPSPVDRLLDIRDCLHAALPEVTSSFSAIVAALRSQRVDSELPRVAALQSFMNARQAQVIMDLRERCASLSDVICRLEDALKSE